jgi:hypothetical protein
MQKYRLHSEIVEAVQFDPYVEHWPEGVIRWRETIPRDGSFGFIETSTGRFHVHALDWIVRGSSGELHVCNPLVFEATYQPVEEDVRTLLAQEIAKAEERIAEYVIDVINNQLKKGSQ